MNTVELKLKISQFYFNPILLNLYDWLLYGFVSQYLWGCTIEFLVNRYKVLVGKTHLEVGVGTGYLLDKFNPENIVIDLMDLSESCLQKTSQRLKRYKPATFKQNILESCTEYSKQYESICLNYVLHCVPGDFKTKSIAFGNLKELLTPEGVLFGTTVIRKNNAGHVLAQLFMLFVNMVGLFNNLNDDPEELRLGLEEHFEYVDVIVVSSTAVFFGSDSKDVYDKAKQQFTQLPN